MIVTIKPSKISGSIQAPASKSSMQRACAAALLSKGKSIIKNPGYSKDDQAAISIIRSLGAKLNFENGNLIVESNGVQPASNKIDCGESGLSIRMFTPIAAISDKTIEISGSGSLQARPMHFFDDVLPQLEVQLNSNNGFLPLQIKGPLKPKNISIDGTLSSQFLTGLLMAYSAAGANALITVNDLKSKPYIELTLQVMKEFGMLLPINKDFKQFEFSSEPELKSGATTYTVEGDWSGGAFLLVAAAIAGDLQVNGLQNTSRQADKRIVDAMLNAGIELHAGDDFVSVKKSKAEGFTFNATDCPDLFPPLVALAANAKGLSTIRGLRRLKHKESDRGVTLQEEFRKLGVMIDLDDDEMRVHGKGGVVVKDVQLSSHHDHRIAMACAVAALNADLEVEIHHAEAVSKSYPDFWQHLKACGASVSLSEPFGEENNIYHHE